MDKEQKDFIQKISSLSGIKKSSIQMVWEYTMYAMFLDLLENKGKNYSTILVPYLGKILIKESKENPGELDTFLSLSESIKDELIKVKKDNTVDLINYFQENFIDKTIDEIMN